MNDFYTMIMRDLNSGKTSDEIAHELADNLNKAEAALVKQKAAENKKAKETAEKREDVKNIVNSIFKFFEKWYGIKMGEAEIVDVDDLMKSFDKIGKVYAHFDKMVGDETNDEDIIRNFISTLF